MIAQMQLTADDIMKCIGYELERRGFDVREIELVWRSGTRFQNGYCYAIVYYNDDRWNGKSR
jgi:hypothetical protein